MEHTVTIGLVELPELDLVTSDSGHRAMVIPGLPLISKQILLSNLQAQGYDARLVNMKTVRERTTYGQVEWGGQTFTKVYQGRRIEELDAADYDIWGITNNFSQHREVACLTIRHLASQGRPVIVGGSDAIAEPAPYLRAGAVAVVTDKSGAANGPVIEYVRGNCSRQDLFGVILADGEVCAKPVKPANLDEWPLPSVEVARLCLGTKYWDLPFPNHLLPMGSIYPDIGCDRKCDFCQTPTYRLGYRFMSPGRTIEWMARQKEAGAGSVISVSDQFLARVLWDGGREEVLAIMKGLRELGLGIHWGNGLELRKATLGRGFNRPGTDLTPDEELVQALWGWDGKIGAYHAYIPAERPVIGRENYAKLLPWKEHCELLRTAVRAGLPALTYGVIIGFEDETEDSLLRLEEAIQQLHEDLIGINPRLIFQVGSYSISPIPGTPQGKYLREKGLLHFDDPALFGGLWAPSVDTRALGYERIAEWQLRLLNIGTRKGASSFFDPYPAAASTQRSEFHET